MLFSTLFLFEQRNQNLLSENVDLPKLVLPQIDGFLAPQTFGLGVSIHGKFVLVVCEGQAVDAKGVAAAELDHIRVRPALLALLSYILVSLGLHNVAIIIITYKLKFIKRILQRYFNKINLFI